MCVMSMVYDHFRDRFPQPKPDQFTPWVPDDASQRRDLAKLIKEFQEARDAAKKVDELTKQKDCADVEKAKLELRVAELERQLAEARKPRERRRKRRSVPGRKR